MNAHTPLDVHYSYGDDVLTVNGLRFSGTLFRNFATVFQEGQHFTIIHREDDCITTKQHKCNSNGC